MVIDAHTHLGFYNNKNWTPEELVSSMKSAAIDYSLVISETHSGPMDSMLQIFKKFPHIKVIGNINFSLLNDNEIRKVYKYLEEGKIVGIKLYLGYEKYSPSDEKLKPLYSFCEKNNFPIVFHTGVFAKGYSGLLKNSHPLNIDEVATLFPNLKIVMAHMGNPWLMDCSAVIYKNKNVYADLSGFFSEYRTISKNEINFFIKQMQDVRIFMGNFNKMIFGTDYPLYSQKEYLRAVGLLNLNNKEKELIFWKNASLVYNLNI